MSSVFKNWTGILFFFLAISAYSANQIVTNNADSGAGSLRQAIADVGDGEEITFNLGIGNETITILSELSISGKGVTINGDNSAGSGTDVTVKVTTPGTSIYRVFYINANGKAVNISNMTINGGDVQNLGGGGLYCWGDVTLDSVTVSGSKGRSGGGIYLYQGTLVVNNCTISNNTGDGASTGAGICDFLGTSITINNSTISNNHAYSGAGGIFTSNTLTINNSLITGNISEGNAGGISASGTVTINNSTISHNTSNANGGGLTSNGSFTINNCTIAYNRCGSGSKGGGIYSGDSGTLTVRNSLISNNYRGAGTDTGDDYHHYYVEVFPGMGEEQALTDGGYNIVEYQTSDNAYGDNKTFNASTDILYNTKADNTTGYSSWNQNNADLSNQNLNLASSLADNGGSTQTLALTAGSFALASSSTGIPSASNWNNSPQITGQYTDQRGVARTASQNTSIGAYSANYIPLPTQVALTGPPTVLKDSLGKFTLTSVDGSSTPRNVDQDTVYDLTSNSSGSKTFYSDATGNSTITQVTIANGTDSVSFYYRDDTFDIPTITATRVSGMAIGDANKQIRVSGNNMSNFNGSNEYITADSVCATLNNPTQFSMECWISFSNKTLDRYFLAFNNSDKSNNLQLGTSSSKLKILKDGINVVGTTILDNLKWCHVAMTVAADNTIKVYLNGKEEISTTSSMRPPSDGLFSIGQEWDGGGASDFFAGEMDEIRVWSDVRSEAEIRANMHRHVHFDAANLVAYYQLDTGTGAIAYDSTSNANNGTMINSPSWRPSGAFGGSGNALDFDGSDETVDCGSALRDSLVNRNTLTLEAWIKPNALGGGTHGIRSILGDESDSGVNPNSILLRLGDDGLANNAAQLVLNLGGTDTKLNGLATSEIAVGKWCHLAAVYNGSQMRIYVNGVLNAEQAASGNILKGANAGNFDISPYFSVGDPRVFNGLVDEVRVWKTARTITQIREKMCQTLQGDESELAAYYRMDQQALAGQTTLYDQTPNGYNGTLTNMDATSDWVASAAFNTWTGGFTATWAHAGNWTQGAGPVATDNIGIPDYSDSTGYPFADGPTISGDPTINNIVLCSSAEITMSSNLTANGNAFINSSLAVEANTLTVAGALYSPSTLTISTGTVDANGNVDATGGNITFTDAGNLKLAGTSNSLGTFTKGTGTVTYDGAAQNVAAANYYNLVFDGSSNKTLSGGIAIGNTFTINAGTFVHNNQTVTYNGAGQTILALDYSTLALSGTGSTKTFADGTTKVDNEISLTDTMTLSGSSKDSVTVQATTPGAGGTASRVLNVNASGKTVTVENLTLKGGDISGNGNVAAGYGGSVYLAAGTLDLNPVNITGSKAYAGGGVYVAGGTLNVSGSTISQNLSQDTNVSAAGGGGLFITGSANASIANSTISNNQMAGGHGGGAGMKVIGSSTVSIDKSTINGNSSNSAARHNGGQGGGGIYSNATLTIKNSTISGNNCTWVFGGAILSEGGSLYLINSTVSANTVYYSHGYTQESVSVKPGATAYVLNSIIAGNLWTSEDPDVASDIGGGGTINCYYTWYGAAKSTISSDLANSNVTNAYTSGDLNALADNGGPTQTMSEKKSAPSRTKGSFVYNPSGSDYYFLANASGGDGKYHLLTNYATSQVAEPAGKVSTDQRGANRHSVPDIGANELYADYVTNGAGTAWSTATNWNMNNGLSSSVASSSPNADNSTSIIVNHDMNVNADVSIAQTTVNAGKTLTIDAMKTLTVTDESGTDLSAVGNIVNSGSLLINSGASVDSDGGFASTGTVSFDAMTGADDGSLNVAAATPTFGTLTVASSTITHDGGAQTVPSVSYYNLATSGSGTKTLGGVATANNLLTIGSGTTLAVGSSTMTVTNALDVNGTVTISTGTLDANGTVDATGGNITFTDAGNLKLANSTITSLGTLSTGNGTVWYDRAGDQSVLMDTYYNLRFGGSGTKTLAGPIATIATLSIDGGVTLASGNNQIQCSGNWSNSGTFTTNNGTVILNGSAAQAVSGTNSFYNLTINNTHASTKVDASGSTLVVTNDLTITDGIFKSASDYTDVIIAANGTLELSGNITVAGNWDNDGAFTHNNNKVTLDGNSQAISGATSFYDLTKQVAAADTLTFQNGSANKTTVTNTLTLQGASGQLLSLRSDVAGNQWEIDPQNTRTIAYLDVKDSNNVNATEINAAATSIDSGNNTNWNFPSAPTVTSQAVTDVNVTTATGNGNITNLGVGGITQHGVCWSTSANPTIADSKTTDGAVGATGVFTSAMTSLTAGTTYYTRAYATNSFGTSYGTQVTFDTPPTTAITKADGAWNTASTWTGDIVPISTQNATINHVVTLDTDPSIQGLTINSGKSLAIGSNTLTVAGASDVNGTVSISTGTYDANGSFDATGGNVTFSGSGNLKLAGTVTSLGTFTKGTGTVTYDGSAQGVAGVDYYNLVFDGSNNKTLVGGIGIGNTFSINAGTLVHNNQTITYNGADQNILALEYHSLAFSGTGSTKTFADGITKVDNEISLTDTISLTGSSATNVTVQVANPGVTVSRVFFINAPGKTLSIENMTIKGGNILAPGDYTITHQGGAVYLAAGSLTINSVTISEGKASCGGAISVLPLQDNGDANLTLSRSTITGNTSEWGGGVYNEAWISYNSSLVLLNSTISGNVADYGGGVCSYNARSKNASVTVVDSTICGNTASQANRGAGIYNQQDGGGGTATATLTNSLLAYNYLADNSNYEDMLNLGTGSCYGNYNILGNYSLTGSGNTNYSYTNGKGAVLFNSYTEILPDTIYNPVLADNGGNTQTVALVIDSTANGNGVKTGYYDDAGTTKYVFWNGSNWVKVEDGSTVVAAGVTEITTDQRGATRHTVPSTGAFELYLDYVTNGAGSVWRTAANWNLNNGVASSVATSTPSASNSTSITIAHDLNVDADVSIDQTTVNNGKTLTVNNGVTLTVEDGNSDDLKIDGAVAVNGTVSSTGNLDVNGTLTISATGEVDANGAFDATGGNVTFTGAGNLKLGGSTVTSLGTISSDNGTVFYDRAGNQTVLSDTYNILRISGSGLKTLGGAISINGNLTIDSGGTLNVGGGNHQLICGGNWTNSGTFTAQEGTVIFNGSSDSLMSGTSANSFYNLTLNKNEGAAATKLSITSEADVTVSNAFTVTKGTFDLSNFLYNLRLGKNLDIGTDGRWNKHGNGEKIVIFYGTACTLNDESAGGPQNLGHVNVDE